MPNILLTNYYESSILSLIEPLVPNGFTLIPLNRPGRQEVLKNVSIADYILAGGRIQIDKEILDNAVNLKMIHRSGVGLDSIDIDYVKKRNIALFVNKGINAYSVAEHTILLILGILRKISEVDRRTKAGEWLKHKVGITCQNLRGKKVGLIGFGKIASKVALMLKGFDVEIIYYKPSPLSDGEESLFGVKWSEFEDLIRSADILSLHCPLNEKSFKLINRGTLQKMKKGSILINTARGGIVDEDALVEALDSGHIAGVGLDVYAVEPLPKSHRLLSFENALLTPHIGGITNHTFIEMISSAFNNIAYFDSDELEKISSQQVV